MRLWQKEGRERGRAGVRRACAAVHVAGRRPRRHPAAAAVLGAVFLLGVLVVVASRRVRRRREAGQLNF